MSQILLTDVRRKFLEYFKKNNHQIVESSNLVPNNDPTLMSVHQFGHGSI